MLGKSEANRRQGILIYLWMYILLTKLVNLNILLSDRNVLVSGYMYPLKFKHEDYNIGNCFQYLMPQAFDRWNYSEEITKKLINGRMTSEIKVIGEATFFGSDFEIGRTIMQNIEHISTNLLSNENLAKHKVDSISDNNYKILVSYWCNSKNHNNYLKCLSRANITYKKLQYSNCKNTNIFPRVFFENLEISKYMDGNIQLYIDFPSKNLDSPLFCFSDPQESNILSSFLSKHIDDLSGISDDSNNYNCYRKPNHINEGDSILLDMSTICLKDCLIKSLPNSTPKTLKDDYHLFFKFLVTNNKKESKIYKNEFSASQKFLQYYNFPKSDALKTKLRSVVEAPLRQLRSVDESVVQIKEIWHINPTLLSQGIILFVTFFIILIGISCILKVDSPRIFEDKPLTINKEF